MSSLVASAHHHPAAMPATTTTEASPPPSIFAEASRLNNEGVVLFAQGDYITSLSYFRWALQSVIASLQDLPERALLQQQHDVGIKGNEIATLPLSQRLKGLWKNPKLSQSNEDRPELFLYPLVIEQQHLANTREMSSLFCGTATFNMALAFHQKALSCQDAERARDRWLDRALPLYDSCLNFFSDVNGLLATRDNDTTTTNNWFAAILAAVWNNKVQIYYQQGLYEELERDMDDLARATSAANFSPLTRPCFLRDGDLEGILLTAMMLARPSVAQAA